MQDYKFKLVPSQGPFTPYLEELEGNFVKRPFSLVYRMNITLVIIFEYWNWFYKKKKINKKS